MQWLSIERPERALWWTAPAPAASELATEDPLALDYIAQQLGLLMLPAITTRSTRAQAFAMVLYGLALAERAVAHYGLPNTDDSRRRLFEQWERFWALATLEFKKGMPRGDWDTMRGIRGVKANWKASGSSLPLRFKMISRQQELGNLGAYLVPLRRAGLVADGTLRPTPAAHEIIENFWDERRERDQVGRYHDYALVALDPARINLERKHGSLTLAAVGERSRLLSLIERKRTEQQGRLNAALFDRNSDPNSRRIGQLVCAAAQRDITEPSRVLDEAIAGTLGELDQPLRDLLITARAFGALMQHLLNTFDRLYHYVDTHGWVVDAAAASRAVFDDDTLRALRDTARALIVAPRVGDLRRFPSHGAACLRLASALSEAQSEHALRLLLEYHADVQRDRRRGAGWIREDSHRLVLVVTSYTSKPKALRFPSFKLDAVRTLLTDVGRLPFTSATAAEVPT